MDLDQPEGRPEKLPLDLECWSGDLLTFSGLRFTVRPAQADDEPALAEFFRHLTEEDLRFRFLTSVRQVSHERLVEMTHVDHDRTENFLAFVPGDHRVIATGMLTVNSNPERGEVAIATRADYRRRGVARRLLEHLTQHASARGMSMVESIASRDNCALIQLEQKLGFSVRPLPEDPTLVLLQCRLT